MKTILVNGIEVKVTNEGYKEYLKKKKEALKEAEQKMAKANLEELAAENKKLNNQILDILKTDISDLKRKALSQMLTDVHTRDELEYKQWLLNEGKLRSNWEVEDYKLNKKKEWYRNSSDFDTTSKITNLVSFILPFTLGFSLIMSRNGAKEAWIITIPIAVWVALFVGLVGSIIGHSINIRHGTRKGLDKNDDRIRHERNSRNAAVINTIIAGASTYRKSKNAIKEISNPDSWKEMK